MPSRLSARQEQCVRLTAFRTDKEIAAHLGISEATVKKHVHEACQRLGVNRRKAALAILDQNDVDYPKDSMAETDQKPSVSWTDGYGEDGKPRADLATPALGRSKSGPVKAETRHLESSFGQTPLRRVEQRGRRVADTGTPVGGPASQVIDGPDAVLGYRAPPRSPIVRLFLIAILAVVICAVLIAIVSMVSDFHHIVDRFDPRSAKSDTARS